MKLPKLLAGLALASMVLAACGTSSAGNTNKGTINIGVDLPESGAEASNGIPTLNGVKYAVQTAGSVEGYTIKVKNLDDAVNGVHDPQKGAQNMQAFVADTSVLGVVGPFNSNVARAEIPISNRAKLAQISPADRKSTRLNSSHPSISYAVFCLKKKTNAGSPRCSNGSVS